MSFRLMILINRQNFGQNISLFEKLVSNKLSSHQMRKIRCFSTLFDYNFKSIQKFNNNCFYNKKSFNLNFSSNQLILRHLNTDYKRIRQLSAKSRNKNIVLYATAFVLVVLGGTYASVPLYRIYCQSTGKGGKPFIDEKANQKILNMKKAEDRLITVTFSAETTSQMAWNFKPTQQEIRCVPGETVLAFFTAKNPLDRPVDGIATYSVQPYEAGSYLNKIQCFCFEEQRLNPQELVDLPVFFYIDPEYATDPKLENVDHIVLSYTFFEAKKGIKLPTFMSAPNLPKAVANPSTALQKL